MFRHCHPFAWGLTLCLAGNLAGAQDLDLLRTRSASENIVFGNLVKVDESRLSLQSGETLRALRLTPETIVEIDGRPLRLRDLPPNARIRVLLDARDAGLAQRIQVLQEGATPGLRAPESSPLIPSPPVPSSPPPSPPTEPAVAPSASVNTQPIPPIHLGAVFQTSPDGVLVRNVDRDSPASRSGLYIGDAIRRVGDQHVASVDGFFRLLHKRPAGERVPVTVIRTGQELTLDLALPDDHRPYLIGAAPPAPSPVPQPVTLITSGQLGWTLGLQSGAVQITALEPAGLAAASGLQLGDVIVAVQNERVARPDEVLQLIQYYGDSSSVPLTVRRNGESMVRGLALPQATTVAANHAPPEDLANLPLPERIMQLQRQQADQQQLLFELQTQVHELQAELKLLKEGARR